MMLRANTQADSRDDLSGGQIEKRSMTNQRNESDLNCDIPVHEAANHFPLMTGDDFESFKADIAAHGQREPIWMHKGEIVDGRNRYRACIELEISPRTKEVPAERACDIPGFIISQNEARRHESKSQRAMSAAHFLPYFKQQAKIRQQNAGGDKSKGALPEIVPEALSGEARDLAGRKFGVSGKIVGWATVVLASGRDDLVREVMSGGLSVTAAYNEIRAVARKPIAPVADESGGTADSIDTRNLPPKGIDRGDPPMAQSVPAEATAVAAPTPIVPAPANQPSDASSTSHADAEILGSSDDPIAGRIAPGPYSDREIEKLLIEMQSSLDTVAKTRNKLFGDRGLDADARPEASAKKLSEGMRRAGEAIVEIARSQGFDILTAMDPHSDQRMLIEK